MTTKTKNKIGIVVPHIFIHRDILPGVIFSPGTLAIDLCETLQRQGVDVTLFAPGPVTTTAPVVTADLSYFEAELAARGDTYIDLLKKHPLTFITLARQVQSEIIARAYAAANNGELDLIHIYTNEEDIALPFARICRKPVVFTHHDPFNFLVKYKSVFPKYKDLSWISISDAQRHSMPADTNWQGTVYHGLPKNSLQPLHSPTRNYLAYLGRIIEPKGVHLAIEAVKLYNKTATTPLTLKIAGKHYADHAKDTYWREKVLPELGDTIEYVGHIKTTAEKQAFLGNAKALIVPSLFDEPFGMVTIEALACDTPVIGLASGATPELLEDRRTGFIIAKDTAEQIPAKIAAAITQLPSIVPGTCRQAFEARFTLEHMAAGHRAIYEKLIATTKSSDQF